MDNVFFFLEEKFSSIPFQLRGNLALPLLDDVTVTVGNNSMTVRMYQSSHQNNKCYFEKKNNIIVKIVLLFEIDLNDTCLQ